MNKTDPYVDDTVEEVLADAEAMREALEDATTAAAAMIKTEGKIPRIDLDPDAAREQFARYLKAFGPQKLGQELYANLQEMNLISDGRSARRLADGITVILQDGTFRLGEQEPTQDPHVLFLEILQKAGPGGISKTDAKEQLHDLWPQIRTEAASLVRTHARVTGENRDRWVLKELYVAPEPGQPEPVVEESSEEPDGPVLNAEETAWAKEEDFTVPLEDADLEEEIRGAAEAELEGVDVLKAQVADLELRVERLERHNQGLTHALDTRFKLLDQSGTILEDQMAAWFSLLCDFASDEDSIDKALPRILERLKALEEAQKNTARIQERLIMQSTSGQDDKVEVHVHIHKG